MSGSFRSLYLLSRQFVEGIVLLGAPLHTHADLPRARTRVNIGENACYMRPTMINTGENAHRGLGGAGRGRASARGCKTETFLVLGQG